MILYHGSTFLVEQPEIRQGQKFLDFGVGFYTTTSYEQALQWTHKKMHLCEADCGYVSIYEFDYENASEVMSIRHFDTADADWLQFVTANRQGLLDTALTDMTIGPVADDNVYRTVQLFEAGIIDAETAVKLFKTQKYQDQWTFHTAAMLKYCKFVRAIKVQKE